MGKLIIGLVIGLILGAGGGWLIAKVTVVDAIEQKLSEEKSVNDTNKKQLDKLRAKHDGLVQSSTAELAQLKDQLAVKDSKIAALVTEKEQIVPENDKLRAQNKELAETIAAYKETHGELTAEPAKPEPENPDMAYGQKIGELMKKITVVGGPLNDIAVKELELDENQVAGINELLKEEEVRMRKHILGWAAGFIKDKTAEELAQMSNIKLGYALGSHVTEELEILQKLKPEDRRTLHIKNHFVKFLPKDGKLVSIVKKLYEERQKTYEGLAAYVGEEQEKTFKEKYFRSGTFIFPGLGSFGIGHLTPEDFEE